MFYQLPSKILSTITEKGASDMNSTCKCFKIKASPADFGFFLPDKDEYSQLPRLSLHKQRFISARYNAVIT